MLALIRGRPIKEIQALLEQGEDFMHKDRDGLTALHIAIESGHYEGACFLIRSCQGIDVNATARSEDTPLKVCARIGDQTADVVRALVGARVKVDYVGNLAFCESENRSALHVAASSGSLQVLELLISWRADLGVKDVDVSSIHYYSIRMPFQGRTPLHLAAMNSQRRAYEILTLYGANPHQPDNFDQTPAELFDIYFGEEEEAG
jgi:ankyrin repeat protein